jgi:hypothetical protein
MRLPATLRSATKGSDARSSKRPPTASSTACTSTSWGTTPKPKTLDDAQIQKSAPVEVRPLGKMYDRILTEEELVAAWESTAGLYHMLVAKQDKRGAA